MENGNGFRVFCFVYLFFQLGILQSQFLVIEIGIVVEGRATTRRANDVLEGLSDGYVLASYLVVLCSECTIIGSFVLRLNCLTKNK